MLELKRPESGATQAGLAALCLLALAGCDRPGATDPGGSSDPLFSRQIGFPDLQGSLASGPARRVKIELMPGTLTAKKVVIKRDEQLKKPERIESQITDIAITTTDTTLTLALGGLHIVFSANTRFRGEHEDEDQDDPAGSTLDEFVARVKEVLASGRQPAVEVQREPPATTPQAPDDESFVAQVIRLDDAVDKPKADKPKIEINVDNDNLVSCATLATPPAGCLGVLKVLNRSIVLQEGVTRLEQRLPNTEGELRFEGTVVDVTASTATLADGTILRIVAGTKIEGESGDEHDGLASLAEVKTALGAGQTVLAKGEGLLETADPRTLDVIEVRFNIEHP